MKIECNECGGEISVANDAMVGEIITCPDCGADFEIISKKDGNVQIKQAESVGEDWGE